MSDKNLCFFETCMIFLLIEDCQSCTSPYNESEWWLMIKSDFQSKILSNLNLYFSHKAIIWLHTTWNIVNYSYELLSLCFFFFCPFGSWQPLVTIHFNSLEKRCSTFWWTFRCFGVEIKSYRHAMTFSEWNLPLKYSFTS